jgi:hypothetical protein
VESFGNVILVQIAQPLVSIQRFHFRDFVHEMRFRVCTNINECMLKSGTAAEV